MEVAVVEDDGAVGAALADDEVLVQGEAELRVPAEVALHLDAAVDRRVDDGPDGEKSIVSRSRMSTKISFLSPRPPPAPTLPPLMGLWTLFDGVVFVERLGTEALGVDEDRLVVDEGLEVLRRRALGVAKVDDLVQQLVDQDEVLPDRLLAQRRSSP